MTKLSDTQAILLSTAAQRDSRSLLPLPVSIAARGAPKAIVALVKRGLAEECETADAAYVHRVDGDIRYGLFATAAGLTAIGIEPDADATLPLPSPAVTPARPSKTAAVIALLQRPGGATLAELITETGWLPHTTRAALTSLRKKGHAIERSKRGDVTCYRLAVA